MPSDAIWRQRYWSALVWLNGGHAIPWTNADLLSIGPSGINIRYYRNFYQNTKTFVEENAFENVVYNLLIILPKLHGVNFSNALCSHCHPHWWPADAKDQGPVSVLDKTSYCKISQSLEAAKIVFKMYNCSEIWQAPQQQCCWCVCKISKRCNNLNYQSCSFEILRDLTIRHLIE